MSVLHRHQPGSPHSKIYNAWMHPYRQQASHVDQYSPNYVAFQPERARDRRIADTLAKGPA